MSHQREKLKTEFRTACAEFNTLVGRGKYGEAAKAAGRAGQAAAKLRGMTESPDWAADARRWQGQQTWARDVARGGA